MYSVCFLLGYRVCRIRTGWSLFVISEAASKTTHNFASEMTQADLMLNSQQVSLSNPNLMCPYQARFKAELGGTRATFNTQKKEKHLNL